jgi:hypothetical protein
MAHRDYERDDVHAVIITSDPGYWEPLREGGMRLPRSADAYCEGCNEAMTITPDDFEGMPKQGDDVIAVCWSCGLEQLASYDIVPEWMTRKKPKEDSNG